jgi:hypothetical protein
MTSGLSLDVATAPPAVLTRISAAINRRPKRVFGVLKIENEYVGYVHAERFEIWERRQRAVHAVGTVGARRGGSHIEVRFILPMRTRVLVVLFFALYAVVAVGLALRSPEDAVTTQELLAAVSGAVVLGAIFIVAAVRQRADLRRFVERIFGDVPPI